MNPLRSAAPSGRTLHPTAGRAATLLASLLALGATAPASAAPFDACPSEAFLIQRTIATMYGVNLATGYYRELSSDLRTSGKINALGFNFHDNYLYGWGYEYRSPVRIDSNYEAVPLAVANLPNVDFYVGDIAVDRNVYYVYRSGAGYGLYAIDLDTQNDAPVQAVRVVDGATLQLAIYDMAFHPTNSLAYAVDRNGTLHEIDAGAGTARSLSDVGVTGTFGAAYFDVDGYLYISRNSDGYVFRIDIRETSPSAEFYAYGPSSNNNDGARCALAPIVDEAAAAIDFGDAPDSYGTSLAENGARHDIGGGQVFLGKSLDGESDAFIYPLTDDAADRSDDEDGVQFVTGLELGEDAIVIVDASSRSYLNAWIDWNRNGLFDADEQVFSAQQLEAGPNNLSIRTPLWSQAGATWARFRVSTTPGVGPIGGVSDGEVEDYQVSVIANGVTESVFPSANGWSTLAYEDNWPIQGDYDMNDLVVNLRTRELSRDGLILGIEIAGELAAVGGVYHNGFAIRLPGIDTSRLPNAAIEYRINGRLQNESPLESPQGEVILVVTDDAWKYVSPGEGCHFYRTEAGCEAAVQMNFELRVSFGLGVPAGDFPVAPYDPFMFATPGFGRVGFDSPPGRSLEIHLPGAEPTDAFDYSLLGRGDDRSTPESGDYFRTETGMPWALHVASKWAYPQEFRDITDAYPDFADFVDSAGSASKAWYLRENADPRFIFFSE